MSDQREKAARQSAKLFKAIAQSNPEQVKSLLDAGVDPMADWGDSGTYRLAIESGNLDPVKVFLEDDPSLARAGQEGHLLARELQEKAQQAGDGEQAEQFGRIAALIDETKRNLPPPSSSAEAEAEAGM